MGWLLWILDIRYTQRTNLMKHVAGKNRSNNEMSAGKSIQSRFECGFKLAGWDDRSMLHTFLKAVNKA